MYFFFSSLLFWKTWLWHMVKGRAAVRVGLVSVFVARCVFDTFYLNMYSSWKKGRQSVSNSNLLSSSSGMVGHYKYLLPFIALKMVSLVVSQHAVWPAGGRGCVNVPSCGLEVWTKWNQTYLLDISMELVHIQLETCSLFVIFIFPLCMIKKNITRTLIFRTTWFYFFFPLTPMKPEGQLCSGVYKMFFFSLFCM